MPISFADLKKNSKSSIQQLAEELNKLTGKTNYKDPDENTYWQPTVDKAGNGYAVIRWLPAPPGEDVPFVRIFEHSFQGPTGMWYIEKSLTTIGQQDPVAELNSKLWNSGSEEAKEIARKQKRKLSFVSNILVVKDPANPENNGKVFRFRYGKKLFDKLNAKMNPEMDIVEPMNPFCLWEGANFRLIIRNVAGYRNYDSCEFDSPAPLPGTDEELEAIWKSEYSLQELIAPEKFKSYDELSKRLALVTGASGDKVTAKAEDAAPWADEAAPKAAAKPSKARARLDADEDEDDDPVMGEDFFKNLGIDDE